ncbi:tRNA1(Val) (adenine(37)-N6)-methyltransferase [Fulvitalea axinellae]|uniref:tRNA1(Val) (adenine(37)-N6)-methyltransferase n=1 Tax=Fulvitalea axinellae TaxID=1182444 RepID=A0AAU9CTW7_9BACT|nr:tRNA1(Val) (adenine(37)-N6)-methyltransferase [Fulvitalea axinellae]
MANDYFEFKQFRIQQDRCGMKVSTDACLFGSFVTKPGAKNILDIGTGTGLLTLMLAQRHPNSQITAVEIDSDAFQQALENFKNSPWYDRLNIEHASIQEFVQATDKKFDLIICNPPFYPDHIKSSDQKRSKAFHNDHLSFSDLAQSCSKLISDSGEFFLLLPERQSREFEQIAKRCGLFLQTSTKVRGTVKGKVIREIGSYSKKKVDDIPENEIAINSEPGVYTEEFTRFMKPYYLFL